MIVSDLLQMSRQPDAGAVLYIAGRRRQGRWQVEPFGSAMPQGRRAAGWWARPRAGCGDTPDRYHAKYVMAVLSSVDSNDAETDPAQRTLPEIAFGTEESVRLSMALNGMRMTMEYFQAGSERVLQLVHQRLAAGQRDVVHDVLVYLAQYIQDLRELERETRLLRAESVAAYLGLDPAAVNELFLADRLDPVRLTERINNGVAGALRRSIDVAGLVRSQVELLRPALEEHRRDERQALSLLDQIVAMLRHDR